MKRILQVSYLMNREGVQTLLMNLYRNIDREKIQFDFLVHSDSFNDIGAYDSEILSLGGRIYHAPRFTKDPINYYRFCNKFFNEHPEYTIMHSHYMKAASSTIFLSAKRHGIFSIAHSHNNMDQGSLLQCKVIQACRYPVRFLADYFMACSIEAGQYAFGSKIISGEKFEVLKNGIALEKYRYNPNVNYKGKVGLPDVPVFGHVGRFAKQKNHVFLLKIFADILNVYDNALLLLVGDGEEKNKIIEYAKKLGIFEHIVFAGSVDNVADYLRAMDVFLFPSLFEGFGLAGIEAQATGLPVIMSTGVSVSAKCTDLCKAISLQDPVQWVKTACDYYKHNNKRYDRIDEIRDKGFDIVNSARSLQYFYEHN